MSDKYKIIHGNMLEVLKTLQENSIDAIVCDPPYEINFMGRGWDKSGIAFQKETWAECLRVLKPGGYLVAFGAARTMHRITCAIEDAGFEIRDTLQWVFGNGFPKSLDVGKAIAKRAGGEIEARAAIEWMKRERERLGLSRAALEVRIFGRCDGNVRNWEDAISLPRPGLWPQIRAALGHGATLFDAVMERGDEKVGETTGSYGYQADGSRWKKPRELREPNTEAAKTWHGYGTALKPAHEPITLARKPLQGTVAANVAKWGTGGIDVDGCRVGESKRVPGNASCASEYKVGHIAEGHYLKGLRYLAEGESSGNGPNVGRWPPNLIIDDGAGEDRPC
jgi:hypothetical protein